jgi:transcriptional regulator with XRE-family HTH domain
MPHGEIVKALRKERGWSQADLATHVGGDAGQISRYENGKDQPVHRRRRQALRSLRSRDRLPARPSHRPTALPRPHRPTRRAPGQPRPAQRRRPRRPASTSCRRATRQQPRPQRPRRPKPADPTGKSRPASRAGDEGTETAPQRSLGHQLHILLRNELQPRARVRDRPRTSWTKPPPTLPTEPPTSKCLRVGPR